jgi:exopolyphosphatase/guanosine-5'-triphosphate,3'-diphosphate pyrophosphatase
METEAAARRRPPRIEVEPMFEAPESTLAESADSAESEGAPKPPGRAPCYAALDLGTNNCRLLIATPTERGFRIVEAFSRIVRLGEGLTLTGRLQPEAMDRAIKALKICADKIQRRKVVRLRAVTTQACRQAENGAEFVARVEKETGLRLTVISASEEARLSVAGCANLIDREAAAALVIDVGGGSTELSWVEMREGAPGRRRTDIRAWMSAPIGVVSLAERFPEPETGTEAWYREMVATMRAEIEAFRAADTLRPAFEAGQAHLVGTSGAITSLAGLHLNLQRYERSKVDGLWLTRGDCEAAANRLLELGPDGRAAEPCIGRDRADLVLAGAAILQAVQEVWPCERVRVADRGLREGMLMSLMRDRRRRRRRRR